MKKWVLYIISVVFCTGFFACTAEEDLVNDTSGKELNVLVSFNLNTPSARTSSSDDDDLDPNYKWERYIDATDIRVLVFKGDTYQEEVKGLLMEGEDGNETRRLTGRITKAYNGEEVKLVVLTGMKSRGVTMPTLTPGETTASKLYQQLTFNYTEAWSFSENEKKYIPMWGMSEGFTIKEGEINEADTIYMYRAIAKIDIKVKNGQGIDGFNITKIELCNTPTQGYCAPLKNPIVNGAPMEKPFFANYAANPNAFTVCENNSEEKTLKIENKIYVPEMGFNEYGGYSHSNFHIKITAIVSDKERVYSIYMRSNQTDPTTSFEIIRNHKYIININSVTMDGDALIGYSVNSWGESTIELPFN